MLEKAIMAGFGGQGLMFMGKLVVQTMMIEGENVTYFPSYGAEVRGGTAHCHTIVSSDEIYSPVVEEATTLVIMNRPSLEKFAPRLLPGGIMLLNSSMVTLPEGMDVQGRVYEIPATQAASELGDVRVGNMIMMGAYNHFRKLVPVETLFARLAEALPGRKAQMLDLNKAAIVKGAELAGATEPEMDG